METKTFNKVEKG